jgi:hypothetical protein
VNNHLAINRGQFLVNHFHANILAIGLDFFAINLVIELIDLTRTFLLIKLTEPISYRQSIINLIVASSLPTKLVSRIKTSCILSVSSWLCCDWAAKLTTDLLGTEIILVMACYSIFEDVWGWLSNFKCLEYTAVVLYKLKRVTPFDVNQIKGEIILTLWQC